MKTIVGNLLPRRFLVQHSIYTQTCAHIELVCWQIVRIANGDEVSPLPKSTRCLKTNMPAEDVAQELRKCSKVCAPNVAVRIYGLVDQLVNCMAERNEAAHVAWYFDDDANELVSETCIKRVKKNQTEWLFATRSLSETDIDLAIDVADRLLRDAIDIRINLGAQELDRRIHCP